MNVWSFTVLIGAGISWAAAFLACVVALVALIGAAVEANLSQTFSLTGAGMALAGKYAALAGVAAVFAASLLASLTIASGLSRRGAAVPGAPGDSWIPAGPPWLRWWEDRVAGPVRTFMARPRG